MATAALRGELVLSIGNGTLRGTVGGTALDCRILLGPGLKARLTPAVYRISAPTKHATTGTVAYATRPSTGLAGGVSSPPGLGSGAASVMFDPDPVEIEKTVPWGAVSKDSSAGSAVNRQWTPTGGPGTLVFAPRSMGGWNDVVVQNDCDELMRALTAQCGCRLIVER